MIFYHIQVLNATVGKKQILTTIQCWATPTTKTPFGPNSTVQVQYTFVSSTFKVEETKVPSEFKCEVTCHIIAFWGAEAKLYVVTSA